MMRIRSVAEWREGKVKSLLQELEEDPEQAAKQEAKCGNCSGAGTIVDYGEATGQAFDADCDACDGAGVLSLEPSSLVQATQVFTFDEFTSELESDLKALARWTQVPPEVVLSQHGFRCWSNIENRALRCMIDNPSIFS